MTRIVTVLACMFWAFAAQGHELRPGYLQIIETGEEFYDLLWKVPARGEFRLSLTVELPQACLEYSPVVSADNVGAIITRWRVGCPGGLLGRQIGVRGLSGTYTDVIMRLERLDGTAQTARLTPDVPQAEITAAPTAAETARVYFVLGIERIAMGLDHLLFVFALLLLIRNVRTHVATITAFTFAHSITLAFVALGIASVP
jgi:hypothetical protein